MVQLQKDLDQITAAGSQLVVVSYDAVSVLRKFAEARNVTYPMLSDPDSKAIDAYQVRNHRARGRQAGIPHPTTFVIDPQGVIQAKLPGTVRQRHSTEALLEALEALDEAAKRP